MTILVYVFATIGGGAAVAALRVGFLEDLERWKGRRS